MDDYDNLPLAEFYFYTIGDKDVYNQELNDLFVCYTLTRGLQIQCDSPRRPALPLELILRITRFAGFVNHKPDITLTSEAFIFTKSITEGPYSAELYITERLSRVQLASMARLQLVESSYGGDLNVSGTPYLGNQCVTHLLPLATLLRSLQPTPVQMGVHPTWKARRKVWISKRL